MSRVTVEQRLQAVLDACRRVDDKDGLHMQEAMDLLRKHILFEGVPVREESATIVAMLDCANEQSSPQDMEVVEMNWE